MAAKKALDKKALWKSIEADERHRRRALLEGLTGKVRAAREAKLDAFARVRAQCNVARDRARSLSVAAKEAASRARAARGATRGACAPPSDAAALVAAIAAARAAFKEEDDHIRVIRAGERSLRSRAKASVRTSARESRDESDDEVLANIPPDMIPLWVKVKRGIKATPRLSRTEAFFKYAEESPDEVVQAYAEAGDDLADEMIREHERALRQNPAGARARAVVPKELSRTDAQKIRALTARAVATKQHAGDLQDLVYLSTGYPFMTERGAALLRYAYAVANEYGYDLPDGFRYEGDDPRLAKRANELLYAARSKDDEDRSKYGYSYRSAEARDLLLVAADALEENGLLGQAMRAREQADLNLPSAQTEREARGRTPPVSLAKRAQIQEAKADYAERLRVGNPALVAVDPSKITPTNTHVLGKLSTVEYARQGRVVFVRGAPLLAYHACGDRKCPEEGKLVVIYEPKPSGGKASAEYKRTHWGEGGNGKHVVGIAPRVASLRELGPLRRIIYTTRKGGDPAGELVDYDHAFDGARPTLLEHRCHEPQCAERGRLVIAGGDYRVTERGIVG